MEYTNTPPDLTGMMLQQITERLNEQARAIADLRTALDAATHRLDEADHMTSEEYGAQVIQQIMASMPAIQAAAMKKAKHGGRR